jgi:hypothetical protein
MTRSDRDGRAGQASGMDWADLNDSTGRIDSGCNKQDRNLLSKSSSTLRSGIPSSKRRLDRPQPEGQPGTASSAMVGPSDLTRRLSIAALAVLVGLTSWAIASVSSGLVGLYASAMVLIFALPRSDRSSRDPKSEDDGHRDQPQELGEPERRLRVRRKRSDSAVYGDCAGPDTSASESPPSTPAVTPQRRARSRVRKTVKPSAEPVAEQALASWLQVAPGKFVRSDAQPAPATALPEPHAPVEADQTPANDADQERDPTEEAPELAPPMCADPVEPILGPETDHPGADLAGSWPVSSPLDGRNVEHAEVQWVIPRHAASGHALGHQRRIHPSHGIRNVLSGTKRSGTVSFRSGANARWRPQRSRNPSSRSKPRRRFLPRSPPRRF